MAQHWRTAHLTRATQQTTINDHEAELHLAANASTSAPLIAINECLLLVNLTFQFVFCGISLGWGKMSACRSPDISDSALFGKNALSDWSFIPSTPTNSIIASHFPCRVFRQNWCLKQCFLRFLRMTQKSIDLSAIWIEACRIWTELATQLSPNLET